MKKYLVVLAMGLLASCGDNQATEITEEAILPPPNKLENAIFVNSKTRCKVLRVDIKLPNTATYSSLNAKMRENKAAYDWDVKRNTLNVVSISSVENGHMIKLPMPLGIFDPSDIMVEAYGITEKGEKRIIDVEVEVEKY